MNLLPHETYQVASAGYFGEALMKHYLEFGGALLALVFAASAADARMLGGGSTGMSHMSGGMQRTSLSETSRGSQHNTWKKPIDSDGGGSSDPIPKPIKKGNGGGTVVTGGYYPAPLRPGYPHSPHR
jgi:hypothetical protein